MSALDRRQRDAAKVVAREIASYVIERLANSPTETARAIDSSIDMPPQPREVVEAVRDDLYDIASDLEADDEVLEYVTWILGRE